MKKIFLASFIFLIISSLVRPSFAIAKADISLSDAVYADLAIRHNLDDVSVFFSDGKKSDDVRLNEKHHWLPASTVKTFAAMYAYKLIADDKLHSWDSITIDAKNNVPTELVTPELPTLLEGDTVTIQRLIDQMITQSDNTAYNQLVDVLGRDKITEYIQSLGLKSSHVGSKLNLDSSQEQYEFDQPGYGINTTTAEDYAKAFELIKNNKIPGAKSLFNTLAQQKINNMIPLFLPKTVVCAHKTGDLDPLYHDGGICQDKNNSYIVTIFTRVGDPNLVAHLSELVYSKNYNLVGLDISKATTEDTQQHPLDPLVMNPPKTVVLGDSTVANFPVPDITAADLGIKSQDLSLILKDNQLPHIFIPVDSPFHAVSDGLQLVKKAFALGPKARTQVDLQTARLRIAEAKDLVSRGKVQDASIVLGSIQQGLTTLAKESIISHDASAQNTIQAVSETRFEILGNQLQQAKGDEKLAIIKDIADQARATVHDIQPNIPDATNATNPSQKPLVGEVVQADDKKVVVKTAGGQEVTIPVADTAITVKEKTSIALIPSPTPNAEVSPTQAAFSPAPSISPAPPLSKIAVGTTVALVGSTTNNTFAPSVVITNLPKELAAPEPVTVAKVDTKNNTMVVVENGVYTQVNINKSTNIKGADTNIPLKEIKQGDVVVVHGEPLTQSQPTVPTATPTVTAPTITNGTPTGSRTPQDNNTQVTSTPGGTNGTNTKASPTGTRGNVVPTTSSKSITPILNNAENKIAKPTSSSLPGKTTTPGGTTPSTQPKVIQSTSIQLVEKKADVSKAPSSPQPSQKSQPPKQDQPKPPAQDQPKTQPPVAKPTSDDKKK